MSRAAQDPGVGAVAAVAGAAFSPSAVAALSGACRACPELVATRQRVVPGDVKAGSRLLLVGEAPGAQEDAVGRPFVGKAGHLLDELLAAAGLARDRVSVLNVLRCRPPDNRAPTRLEAARCTGWLDRQIALLYPTVVVTLGATALAWALGRPETLASVRGAPLPWRGRWLLPTYHPSAALRFGRAGAPRAALAADLALAASTLADIDQQSVHLRTATADDAADVRAVSLAAFSALPLTQPSGVLRETDDSVAADLALHNGAIATVAGHVVGALRLRPDGGTLWLRRVAVAPGWQRRGIGTALIGWAHARATSAGYAETRCGVRSELPANLAYWQHHGYAVDRDHKHPVTGAAYWVELVRTAS